MSMGIEQADMTQITIYDFSRWYQENKLELLDMAKQNKEMNEELASDFLEEWPLQRLKTMKIDEYVTGKGSQNKSLCYEIEHGKYAHMYLSIKGGSAGKFGIYWSKKKKTYCDTNNMPIPENELDKKFTTLKKDLVSIITKGINADFSDVSLVENSFFNRSSMITKLLCVYSKNGIYSGINLNAGNDQKKLWRKLVSFWGKPLKIDKKGGVYKQNLDITERIVKRHPELDGYLLGSILWQFRNVVLYDNENTMNEDTIKEVKTVSGYQLEYSNITVNAKNIILRGAPGTGKTFLANQIAADIISGGRTIDIANLTNEEMDRTGFVQFHPSYDYTDFVEGLRPTTADDGVINFTLRPGSFMSFIEKAKGARSIDGQDNFEEAWQKFFDEVSEAGIEGSGYNKLSTLTGKPIKNLLSYDRNEMQGVYPAGKTMYWNHDQIYNVYRGLPGVPKGGLDGYRKAIVAHLKAEYGLKNYKAATISDFNDKNYVFIIDEINRGEISKIFGELFFSIDPEYRDHKAGVYTQYANLHKNPEEKFYIPSNVYIIGTMNDIDRSVDTFDFAMRRRFTFLEITAEESAENMCLNSEVKKQMARLNDSIIEKGSLTMDYQIGASYFKDLYSPEVDENDAPLWNNKLYPLLKDYFRGEHKANNKLSEIKKDYFSEED